MRSNVAAVTFDLSVCNRLADYPIGWALVGLGNYKQAIIYLDKALAIYPNDKYALNNKGWALTHQGSRAA